MVSEDPRPGSLQVSAFFFFFLSSFFLSYSLIIHQCIYNYALRGQRVNWGYIRGREGSGKSCTLKCTGISMMCRSESLY